MHKTLPSVTVPLVELCFSLTVTELQSSIHVGGFWYFAVNNDLFLKINTQVIIEHGNNEGFDITLEARKLVLKVCFDELLNRMYCLVKLYNLSFKHVFFLY